MTFIACLLKTISQLGIFQTGEAVASLLIRSNCCDHIRDTSTNFELRQQPTEGDALDSVITLDALLRSDCDHITASALSEFFQSAVATLKQAGSGTDVKNAVNRFALVTQVLEQSEQAMHQIWSGLHTKANTERIAPIANVLEGDLPRALPNNASPGLTLSLHCGLLALYYGHFDAAVNVRQALRIAAPSPQLIDRAFAFMFHLYLCSRSPSAATH